MFISSSRHHHNWSLIPAIKWTPKNKIKTSLCVVTILSEVIIKRNLVKKVPTKKSAQPEYQHIFSVKTWRFFLTRFEDFCSWLICSQVFVSCSRLLNILEILHLHTKITICEIAVGLQLHTSVVIRVLGLNHINIFDNFPKILTIFVNSSGPKTDQNISPHISRFCKTSNLNLTTCSLTYKVVSYH